MVLGYVTLAMMIALHPHKDVTGWHQKQASEIIKREKARCHVF